MVRVSVQEERRPAAAEVRKDLPARLPVSFPVRSRLIWHAVSRSRLPSLSWPIHPFPPPSLPNLVTATQKTAITTLKGPPDDQRLGAVAEVLGGVAGGGGGGGVGPPLLSLGPWMSTKPKRSRRAMGNSSYVSRAKKMREEKKGIKIAREGKRALFATTRAWMIWASVVAQFAWNTGRPRALIASGSYDRLPCLKFSFSFMVVWVSNFPGFITKYRNQCSELVQVTRNRGQDAGIRLGGYFHAKHSRAIRL